jgi:hypothetical protein
MMDKNPLLSTVAVHVDEHAKRGYQKLQKLDAGAHCKLRTQASRLGTLSRFGAEALQVVAGQL